jgi:glutathione S-transferase
MVTIDALSFGAGVALSGLAVFVFRALSRSPAPPSGKPHLIYFPVAGRGELSRLIAAAGGLEIKETNAGAERSEYDTAKYGSPSGLPLLEHGNLKISQSAAIECYLADLVPKFAGLTPAQRATDHMLQSIKEDVLAGCAKVIFGDYKNATTEIPKQMDRWLPVIEGLLPSEGFILGLGHPTVADLAVLNMARGYMPFGAAYKHGKYDYTLKYPKFKALVERTAATPGVSEYLAKSPSLTLSFLDVDKK